MGLLFKVEKAGKWGVVAFLVYIELKTLEIIL